MSLLISLGLQEFRPDFAKAKARPVIHEHNAHEEGIARGKTIKLAAVLGLIFLNPRISRKELIEESKFSDKTVHSALLTLEKNALIKRTVIRSGSVTNHYFEITK